MPTTTKRRIASNHWAKMGNKRKMQGWPEAMPPVPRWYVPQWLEYTGTSQASIINATGLSPGYVSDLVNGKERFNQDVLWAFSFVIKCPWGMLLDVNPMTEDGRLLAEMMLARKRRKVA